MPARWDFPHVTAEEFALPEVKVGTWAGFVFINPDPDAEPARGLPRRTWPTTSSAGTCATATCRPTWRKVIRANWKIAQEAFCEAFHVNATHPQILPYIGDANSQVDVWDNFSRVITPAATPSPLLDWAPDEETILRYALDVRVDEELFITVKEGQTARSAMADATRDRWRPIVGDADRRVVRRRDGRQPRLHAVPQLPPVGGVQPHRLPVPAQRRRPPLERSWRCSSSRRSRASGRRRRPSTGSASDEPWTDAPELGVLGKVFEQDTFNMGRVQLGLESTRKPGVTLANYQESKVRWLAPAARRVAGRRVS